LAGDTLLRDTILQALCTPFTTTEQTKEVAATLVNAMAAVVTTQTFIAHTAEDLEDEEMEVTTPHSHYNLARSYPLLSSHSPNRTCLPQA
jgi:hypothetical protein